MRKFKGLIPVAFEAVTGRLGALRPETAARPAGPRDHTAWPAARPTDHTARPGGPRDHTAWPGGPRGPQGRETIQPGPAGRVH